MAGVYHLDSQTRPPEPQASSSSTGDDASQVTTENPYQDPDLHPSPWQHSREDLPGNYNLAAKAAICIQDTIYNGYSGHKRCIQRTLICLLLVGYAVYVGFAIQHDFDGSIPLIVFTALGLLLFLYRVLMKKFGPGVQEWWDGFSGSTSVRRVLAIVGWVLPLLMLAAILIFVIIDNKDDPQHLISAVGIIVFILAGAIFSKDSTKIVWKMILVGLLIQFILGLIVLRWSHGYDALDFLSEQMAVFLTHSDAGSRFVFGESFADHLMAFQVLIVIIFFGAVAEAMYYFGILQWMIEGLGVVMSVLMRVGPAESFVAAANIFLGPNNSALTVSRFLGKMTLSELHCVMTSGFATVTGSLLGAYISFGIAPSHLVAASFMSAPAALAMAKVFYPETSQSTVSDVKKISFPHSGYHNPWHAYTVGARQCIKIVAAIMASLIGFVAGLEFLNRSLEWFGDRAGVEGLTFQWLCSYIFLPFPFLMGIEIADCREVARLIGVKIFLTDIVGYIELGQLINNRVHGLDGPTISPRSEVIATYALCGFANIPDVSICLGAIGAIAPSRKSDLARVAVRAMVAANIACFITACIAGLLQGG